MKPLFSIVDVGADIILSNGTKIQVKTSSRGYGGRNNTYSFSLHHWSGGTRKIRYQVPNPLNVDFVILWCVEEDLFYIVPADVIRGKTQVKVTPMAKRVKSRVTPYLGKWDLLVC